MKETWGRRIRISSLALSASVLGLLLLPGASRAQSFLLYAGTDQGNIYSIDPTLPAAQATKLVTTTSFTQYGINGLAWDASSQRLYFASTTSSGGSGNGGLYYWDRRSNSIVTVLTAAQLPGSNANNGCIWNGGYWFVDGEGGSTNIYRVDLSNPTSFAQMTNWSGGTTSYKFGDIAIDSSGMLYGIALNASVNNGNNANFDYFTAQLGFTSASNTITVTGFSTKGGGNNEPYNSQDALSQDGSTLYALTSGTTNTLYTMNKTTGAETLIYNVAGLKTNETISDLSGIGALYPTPTPPASVNVLIGALVGATLFGIKRRRKHRATDSAA